ncbi:hypothetical protein FDZ71_09410, partial [bacterium]
MPEKLSPEARAALLKRAVTLCAFTVAYNLVEGGVSVGFGLEDETLALFGFGVDSFIEVVSALGVWHMVRRLQKNGEERRDEFEKNALRITGAAFYLLALGLCATAAINLLSGEKPVSTLWGVAVSLVSVAFMWLLIRLKVKVGRALGSPAILADAACSRACIYLSLALLASSVGFWLTGIGALDAVGALAITVFCIKEG